MTPSPRLALALLVLLTACGGGGQDDEVPLTVYAAGSLVRPLREALDSIAATDGPVVRLEIMGSRELIRAVTSLGRTPDLVVSADADELERRLVPTYAEKSTTFARNRVVLALSTHSAAADSVTPKNWIDLATAGRLRIARADPGRAPLGYRTALVWRLAELQFGRKGLAAQLAKASPDNLLRGNESDLTALLESGDADAAWCYESLARALSLRYIALGDSLDLGAQSAASLYSRAAVRIAGDRVGDSVTVVGTPIRYAMAVLSNSRDPMAATLLRERLLDARSRRIMQRAGLDVLEVPVIPPVSMGDRISP